MKTLGDYIDGLTLGDLNPITPEEAEATLMRAYQIVTEWSGGSDGEATEPQRPEATRQGTEASE